MFVRKPLEGLIKEPPNRSGWPNGGFTLLLNMLVHASVLIAPLHACFFQLASGKINDGLPRRVCGCQQWSPAFLSKNQSGWQPVKAAFWVPVCTSSLHTLNNPFSNWEYMKVSEHIEALNPQRKTNYRLQGRISGPFQLTAIYQFLAGCPTQSHMTGFRREGPS